MKTVDKRFKDVVFVVEATHFEQHCLWKEHHEKLNWEEDSHGFWQTIGHIADMPITINVFFAKILGQTICFYESPSMVTHHDMVKDWIIKQAGNPKWDNESRRAHCDAWNFHHCVAACRQANGEDA